MVVPFPLPRCIFTPFDAVKMLLFPIWASEMNLLVIAEYIHILNIFCILYVHLKIIS